VPVLLAWSRVLIKILSKYLPKFFYELLLYNLLMNNDSASTILHWLQTGSINIFGVPFAGKDTQAARLGKLLNAPVVGSGQILRGHHEEKRIKELSSTGELFPSDYYFSIVLPFLSKPEFANKPLVLSSVGRWSGEEEVILDSAKKAGHPLKAVVLLKLENDEVYRRFELSQKNKDRGLRHDDAEHLIDVRLKEFSKKTMPVIEAYRRKGLLLEVNGMQSLDDVTQEMVEILVTRARKYM